MARKSDYKPEFCNTVVELGKQGKSIAQMACQIGVHRDSLYEWAKQHEEFSDAFTRGTQESLAYWEQMGQEGAEGKREVNAPLWSRSMAARFPKDYTERKATELTGKDGAPIEIAHTSLSEADLTAKIEALQKALGMAG